MIKAIFLDNDGTLFSHQEHRIPSSAWKALSSVQEKGIRIILNTGRDMSELDKLKVTEFPFDGYIILNGQLCLDEKRIPYHKVSIEGDMKDRLISWFEEKKYPMAFSTEKEIYINEVSPIIEEVQAAISTPVPPVHGYDGEDILLTVFYMSEEEISSLDLGDLCVTRWHDGAVDVVSKGGSKANGILQYCERYGISPRECMAIGDGENDLEMLKTAGIAVAMGNADDIIKKAADHVTDGIDQDGLYKALKHYELI